MKKRFGDQRKKEIDAIAASAKRGNSLGKDIWLRLLRDKSAVASMGFLCLIILLAIFANILFDEALVTTQNTAIRNSPPSLEHWFGTDFYGRDIFIRMVYGSRVSLAIGIITMGVSMIIGGLLGAVAAYFGGKIDGIIMRLTDMFMAIPETLLALCVVAAMGSSAVSLIAANDCRMYTRKLQAGTLYSSWDYRYRICAGSTCMWNERFKHYSKRNYSKLTGPNYSSIYTRYSKLNADGIKS